MKQRVLFICTHNSARSQMAEAFLNTLYGDRYEGYSAGTDPGTVNSYVIQAMAELGIDIFHHQSKHLTEFQGKRFDYVVTLCDHAKATCPFFPGDRILHKPFPDPSRFTGSPTKIREQVRQVRDAIHAWIRTTFKGGRVENSPATHRGK